MRAKDCARIAPVDCMTRERHVPGKYTHGMANIEPGLRLHYAITGDGPLMIVLLHGFPQTWREWRHIMPTLADAGFCVVAPDYGGAGHSWRSAGGDDKLTMARDVRQLARNQLRLNRPIVMLGHEIGLMIAYTYAQTYRGEVPHLVIMDAPLPGTAILTACNQIRGRGISPFTGPRRCRDARCWSRAGVPAVLH